MKLVRLKDRGKEIYEKAKIKSGESDPVGVVSPANTVIGMIQGISYSELKRISDAAEDKKLTQYQDKLAELRADGAIPYDEWIEHARKKKLLLKISDLNKLKEGDKLTLASTSVTFQPPDDKFYIYKPKQAFQKVTYKHPNILDNHDYGSNAGDIDVADPRSPFKPFWNYEKYAVTDYGADNWILWENLERMPNILKLPELMYDFRNRELMAKLHQNGGARAEGILDNFRLIRIEKYSKKIYDKARDKSEIEDPVGIITYPEQALVGMIDGINYKELKELAEASNDKKLQKQKPLSFHRWLKEAEKRGLLKTSELRRLKPEDRLTLAVALETAPLFSGARKGYPYTAQEYFSGNKATYEHPGKLKGLDLEFASSKEPFSPFYTGYDGLAVLSLGDNVYRSMHWKYLKHMPDIIF